MLANPCLVAPCHLTWHLPTHCSSATHAAHLAPAPQAHNAPPAVCRPVYWARGLTLALTILTLTLTLTHMQAPSVLARLQLAALYAAGGSLIPEPHSRMTGAQTAMQLGKRPAGLFILQIQIQTQRIQMSASYASSVCMPPVCCPLLNYWSNCTRDLPNASQMSVSQRPQLSSTLNCAPAIPACPQCEAPGAPSPSVTRRLPSC